MYFIFHRSDEFFFHLFAYMQWLFALPLRPYVHFAMIRPYFRDLTQAKKEIKQKEIAIWLPNWHSNEELIVIRAKFHSFFRSFISFQ